MSKEESVTKLPGRRSDNCFACSPNNQAGLKMKFQTNGESVFSLLTVPDHLSGWSNLVHGGVITTILDEIMGRAALQFVKRITLTKTISVQFLKPVYVGEELKAEGKLREIKSEREALLESYLYNSEGKLCAKGSAVFATFTPEAVEKLGIIDKKVLQEVAGFINRKTAGGNP